MADQNNDAAIDEAQNAHDRVLDKCESLSEQLRETRSELETAKQLLRDRGQYIHIEAHAPVLLPRDSVVHMLVLHSGAQFMQDDPGMTLTPLDLSKGSQVIT